jgi:hypothetical protein
MADQQPDAQQEHMSVSNKVVVDVLADEKQVPLKCGNTRCSA